MAESLRQRVNRCILRLSDRDTEAMAAAELDAIACSLSSDSIPTFVAAVADVRATDKPAVRRHCVRMLAVLTTSHSVEALSPHMARLVAALLHRLRDGDSSVRSSCAAAAASIASISDESSLLGVLRQLSEATSREQDRNAQCNAALCLAAAMSAGDCSDVEVRSFLHRLLPKMVKLLRSNAFKAKPALLQLLGAAAAAGGASTPALAVGVLMPCLKESLASEDWSARKAAAEALTSLAAREGNLLASCKKSCLAAFESRRYDKVKIVRESMNRMIEEWKAIPDDEADHDGPQLQSRDDPTEGRSIQLAMRKTKQANAIAGTRGRRAPVAVVADKRISMNGNRNVEVTTPVKTVMEDPVRADPVKGDEPVVRSRKEARKMLFPHIGNEKGCKMAGSRSGSWVVPLGDDEKFELDGREGAGTVDWHVHKDGDFSAIRTQLLQIESQQSSLLDLMQKFIGSSENGLSSLERRVQGLEMTLDEISRDLAISSARGSTDQGVSSCCRLPGAEFLSQRFWRRHDGRYSSRFSISEMQHLTEETRRSSYLRDRPGIGSKGGFVINPLAEAHAPQT